MLSPEVKTQVIAVLHARQITDKAFRLVMRISKATPEAEADRRAENFEKCARLVLREERTLANLCIKEHHQESEAEHHDPVPNPAS